MMMRARRLGAGLLIALFVSSLMAIAPASANPAVPMCGPASLPASIGSATADLYDPALCEQLSGRVFPEAFAEQVYTEADDAGHSNTFFATDYVSYYEFEAGLDYLAAAYPDYIEIHEVATSAGTDLTPGETVYLLEITNENSPVPLDERQALLFMLSIHGNEKGGREGGFRVLEDLLKGISFAAEPVQDGAGLPTPIARPGGEGDVQVYRDLLDFQRVFLLFPNTDGWICDELDRAPSGDGCPGTFDRVNANGRDLNRQAPTLGWHRQADNRDVVGQPESIGYYTWMRENVDNWAYAIDIHGMQGHENFGAIMLPAGGMTPLEMEKSLSLAETLKVRMNQPNPHFDEWLTLMTPGETVGGTTGVNPTASVGTSQFAEYYTVIDAIGYTDSGFNGDYFAQDTGLNAPGYDIELAWNHMVAGAQYEAGAMWNNMHVEMTREIVKSFMDFAALDIQVSFDTGGHRTLVMAPTYVATNLDDESPEVPAGSWADQNDGDDLWQYSAENPFISRPAKYWEDLKPFIRDGDEPGVLAIDSASRITADRLAGFDTLVIPGTAINGLLLTGTAPENGLKVDDEENVGIVDQARVDAILAWVEDGGNLILTDSALEFLDLSGLTSNGVDVVPRYMGGIKVDLNNDGAADDHPLLKDLNDGVMQMYEPTPIGFGTTGSAPNWYLTDAAANALGADIVGRECGLTQLNTPTCDGHGVGLGVASHGSGQIHFMGSLLPDPTEEFYHPYGLDNYATTYSGNLVMLNMLGWDKIYAAPPVVITEDGQIIQTANEPVATDGDNADEGPADSGKKTPISGALALVGLGAAALARRKDDDA